MPTNCSVLRTLTILPSIRISWDYHSYIITTDIGLSSSLIGESKNPKLLYLGFFDFLMRGGDSEFINYLKYILQKKYVQNVYEF